MITLEDFDQFVLVFAKITDRQTGDKSDRHIGADQACRSRQRQLFGITAEELGLVKGEKPDIALLILIFIPHLPHMFTMQ